MTATTRRPYPKEHASRHEIVMLEDDLYSLLDRLLELHPRTWITNEIHLRPLKYHPRPPAIVVYNHVRPIDEYSLFVWFAQDGHEPGVELRPWGPNDEPVWDLVCPCHLILRFSLRLRRKRVLIDGMDRAVTVLAPSWIEANYWDELPLGKTLHRKVALIVHRMSSNDLRTYVPATGRELRSRGVRATPAAIAWQQAAPDRVLTEFHRKIVVAPSNQAVASARRVLHLDRADGAPRLAVLSSRVGEVSPWDDQFSTSGFFSSADVSAIIGMLLALSPRAWIVAPASHLDAMSEPPPITICQAFETLAASALAVVFSGDDHPPRASWRRSVLPSGPSHYVDIDRSADLVVAFSRGAPDRDTSMRSVPGTDEFRECLGETMISASGHIDNAVARDLARALESHMKTAQVTHSERLNINTGKRTMEPGPFCTSSARTWQAADANRVFDVGPGRTTVIVPSDPPRVVAHWYRT